tara:strand:+ start:317 stop:550 length:234 start_codon:yes stop_codon:yes gene_type:complete
MGRSIMTQQNGTAPQVEIRMEDIQGVLAEHPLFAALVENRALKRTLKENSDARISKDVPAEVGKNSVGSVGGGNSKS